MERALQQLHTREILRCCGVVLDGPPASELVDAAYAAAEAAEG